MDQPTEQTPLVSWKIAASVWWWITWRSVLASLAIGLLAGIVIGIILGLIGVANSTISLVSGPIGMVLGFVCNVFFFRKALNRKYKNFTVSVTNNTNS